MKITDLRCAVIGRRPIVRIVTDEGLYGLGEVEFTKHYIKPWVLHFRDALIGEDPTDVERVMLKIRQRGSFKRSGDRPEDYAADVKWMSELPEKFFMVKQGISFHSNMKDSIPGFHYGITQTKSGYHGAMDQGPISERGMAHMIDCVIAM